MIQLDLRQGYSKKEYYYKFILKEILNKFYSNQNIEAIKCFNKEEVYLIFCFAIRLYNCGSSIFLFKQIMRVLYKKSIVYASNDYDLYTTAERLKKLFYSKLGTLKLLVSCNKNEKVDENTEILVLEKWRLSQNTKKDLK